MTIDFDETILCACLTLEDIYYWFDPFLNDIYTNNFILVKYEVISFIRTKSMKQIGFYEKDILIRNEI